MQGKKKYVALILFLLIGLMVFTFANPREDEEKEDNKANTGEVVKEDGGKKTTTNSNVSLVDDQNVVVFNAVNTGRNVQNALTENVVTSISQTEDDSYAKALEMVKKAEESLLKGDYDGAQYLVNNLDDSNDKTALQDRLDKVLNAINVSDLVANLEKMVRKAASLADMTDARGYNTSNDIANTVNKLKNEKLKEELTNRLNHLNGLLSDEDSPVITGINDGDVVNTLANVKVEDANTYTITLNGEEYELSTELVKDGEYELVVVDAAFNETRIRFTYDTTAPVLSVKSDSVGTAGVYSKINFKLSDNVGLAKVIVNGKEYKRTGKWSDLNFQNVNNYVEAENTVVLVDKAGNETEFKFIYDKTAPTTILSMRTTQPTNKNLIVTLKASESIKTPNGWSKVSDTTYTKKYTRNTTEEVEIEDLAGNKAIVKISITNIDKTIPTAVITFSNNNGNAMTNQDVTATLIASEAIKTPEGWNKIDDVTYTKVYSQNAKDSVIITDIAGNIAELKYEVKRIDKVAPEGVITTSNNNGLTSTNEDVTATLTTNESILTPDGWTRVKDKIYTKVFSENTKTSVVITDKAGNTRKINFEIKRIDKEKPQLTIVNPNKYYIEAGSVYEEKGYSAYDKVDKDVTNLVKISYLFQAKESNEWISVSNLDTTKLGVYKVVYTAYDKAGNTSKGTRVVAIQDTTAPVITLNGNSNITLEYGVDKYAEEYAIISDNYDETIYNVKPSYINMYTLDGIFQGRVNSVNTSRVGRYNLVYTATDSNDNEAVKVTRIVYVKDTVIPTATITYSESDYGNVVATLTASEAILDLPSDWKMAGKANVYKKSYTKNVENEIVEFKDINGNVGKVSVKIDFIDSKLPDLKVIYSTKKTTKGDVEVTITSDVPLAISADDLKSWVLSDDKKIIKRTYTNNIKDSLLVKSLNYDTQWRKVNIEINNIDKNAPTAKLSYTVENEKIVFTIEGSEPIAMISAGWRCAGKANIYTKTFNLKEQIPTEFKFKDIAGNESSIEVNLDDIK